MLRLALKRNSFLFLFTLFVALFFAACGEEDSATVPMANRSNCATYSYSSTPDLAISPSGGYSYAATTAVAPANTIAIAPSPAKVTITGGYPPFGVSATQFVSMALTYAGTYVTPDAASEGFLPIATTDAVASTNDPSCMTYVFWVTPIGTFGVGTVADSLVITDSKGSTATLTITVVITQGT